MISVLGERPFTLEGPFLTLTVVDWCCNNWDAKQHVYSRQLYGRQVCGRHILFPALSNHPVLSTSCMRKASDKNKDSDHSAEEEFNLFSMLGQIKAQDTPLRHLEVSLLSMEDYYLGTSWGKRANSAEHCIRLEVFVMDCGRWGWNHWKVLWATKLGTRYAVKMRIYYS